MKVVRTRHFDAKNFRKGNACRQRETRETDKTVVAVEIALQNQELGVDCIEGAQEPPGMMVDVGWSGRDRDGVCL